MAMKPDLQRTVLGDIPKEWTICPFADVTRLITCGLAATPTYVRESIGKPFLSAQNVSNGRVVYDNHKYIPKQLFDQITRHNKPERGDILYTRVGAGIGEAGIIEDDYEFGVYVSLTLIKTNPKKLHNRFALHLLNSPFYRALAKNGQLAGGGVQNLNVDVVRKFPIPIPSLAEQRAISDVLSDVIASLVLLERLVEKKRNLKQAAMQQLLTGKTRLPGFHGDWETKRLGEVVEIQKGQLITSDTVRTGNIPVIAGGKQPAYYHDVANRQGKTITISASGASAGYVALHNMPIFASDCSTISEGSDYLVDFIFYQLLLKQQLIYNAQTGGAQPHIHAIDLVPLEIFNPSLPEQNAIATILTDMDKELSALDRRLAKTLELKQGMMQELLTGKTRLIG